ncbi:low molecular weight protein-tyrosine-phosphatase [Labrenzia sp. 011]|uniref:low molecular weight protein-tyrosine-phosphatase n=1 Tax=Labrenzia sp. 011 TaxID=2171494 RepID=UPI000D511D2B|nr:low molecular weight protein-tyrosine-phosphatase [Labrenzia sp. 011]PVB61213.1 protein tyrosine phosphatase [Labrenzia sp. 011]
MTLPRSLLFVCLGNICRSPLAEGVFRSLVEAKGESDRFTLDSAGTGAWHIGKPPDPRSIDIAAKHGVDLSMQRARQVAPEDFARFDIILAMDADNLAALRAARHSGTARIRLLLDDPPMDVPDPYFGGPQGFENVYRLVRSGCERLLEALDRPA